jgi:hypothetical protein
MTAKSTPRVKRHRQRRKRGERMVTIRLTQTEITRLAGIGYGAEPGKPETLATMVEAFLSDSLAMRGA